MIATGSGNLKTTLFSIDQADGQQLHDITLSTSANKFPVTLANFRNQRIQVELRVVEENEYFNISRIVVFVKPSGLSYPVL